MNIQDMKFNQELEALRQEYRDKWSRYPAGKKVVKVKVKFLCERYGKPFERVWKGK